MVYNPFEVRSSKLCSTEPPKPGEISAPRFLKGPYKKKDKSIEVKHETTFITPFQNRMHELTLPMTPFNNLHMFTEPKFNPEEDKKIKPEVPFDKMDEDAKLEFLLKTQNVMYSPPSKENSPAP